MSILMNCPGCQAGFNLSEALEGKRVRCKNCGEPFLVSDAAASANKPAPTNAEEDGPDGMAAGRARITATPGHIPRPERRPVDQKKEEDSRSDRDPRATRNVQKEGTSILPWVVFVSVVGVFLTGIGLAIWSSASDSKKDEPIAHNNQPAPVPVPVPVQPNPGPRPARPAPPPLPEAPPPLKAAAIKIPVEYLGLLTERVLLAGPGSQRAGICSRSIEGKTHYFACFDVPAGKRSSHTELPNLGVLQQMSLSPDGSRLAVVEMMSGQGPESAITIWSLPEGQVLLSRWKPYPGPNSLGVLKKIIFLDANRLLTITTGKQMTLWDLSGEAVYSIEHKIPGRLDILVEDPHTRQPNNFALSADRGSLALFNGSGFDVMDTATGEARGKTGDLVGRGASVHGVALDRHAGRLAVYLWVLEKGTLEDRVVVWNLKTNQQAGSFPIRVKKQTTGRVGGWSGNALSWWGQDHLLLWGGNNNALVLDAATGQPLRELAAPQHGRCGFDDPDGRLWYDVSLHKKAKAYLCAVDFPREDLQGDAGLDGEYYKRWWLTDNGIAGEPDANDARLTAFPRVGPGK